MVQDAADAARAGAGPIRVLFCCEPGYYQHLAVALASLLDSNRARALEVHLITSRRNLLAEARLAATVAERPDVDLQIHYFTLKNSAVWPTSYHITSETYLRFFAAQVLDPAIDKILYLDADLVVVDDLAPLWAVDIAGYALAATPDPFGQHRRGPLGMPPDAVYVNAGVLLLNLARWRAEGLTARLADFVERQGERLLYHDQDAINAVLHEAILPLDWRWNFQARMLRPSRRERAREGAAVTRARGAPAIVHFTSARKPWLFAAATPGKALYWRYLHMTPWRGTAPSDRRISKAPERCVNYAFYWAHSDFTWERLWRATTLGRAIARTLRGLGLGLRFVRRLRLTALRA